MPGSQVTRCAVDWESLAYSGMEAAGAWAGAVGAWVRWAGCCKRLGAWWAGCCGRLGYGGLDGAGAWRHGGPDAASAWGTGAERL